MRCTLSDGRTIELGYCFNVLPGESAAALIEQARRICGPVRARLGVARMGVGLWIARAAATELMADPGARRALAAALAEQGLYVYTLNGFPYGGFHAPRVKHTVYEPSWAEAARVDYTLDLATLLAELLPDDLAGGSISTVPLGPATVDRAAAAAGLRRCAGQATALTLLGATCCEDDVIADARVAADALPVGGVAWLATAFGASHGAGQAGQHWEVRRVAWHAPSAAAISDALLTGAQAGCFGGAFCDYGVGTHSYAYDAALALPASPWRDLPAFADDDPDHQPIAP